MPVIDLNIMSFALLKSKLKKHLWDHFLNHFDDNNNCTLHYVPARDVTFPDHLLATLLTYNIQFELNTS